MISGRHVAIDELVAAARESTEPRSIRAHLDGCARCRATHSRFGRALAALRRADRISRPPRDLVARAKSLFARRPARATGVLEILARLTEAAGGLELASAGVRGSDAATCRLQFAAEDLEVHVIVADGTEGRELTAQVLPGDEPHQYGLAWAEIDGRVVGEAVVEPHGLFTLERLPAESLDLVLELGDRRTRMRVPDEPRE